MQKPVTPPAGLTLETRLRIFAGPEMVLGSGRILLLRLIRETGSISEAARQMQVSYNHAWTLLQVMNRSFRKPLVMATRGGGSKGGAVITEAGEVVLAAYEDMVVACRQAAEPHWKRLRKMLAPAGSSGNG